MLSKPSYFKLMTLSLNEILKGHQFTVFSTADSILIKYIKNKVKQFYPDLIVKTGQELNQEWFDDNCFGLSLFSSSEVYWIINAELMSSNLKKYLQEKDWSQSVVKCFFIFNQSTPKDISKNQTINCYDIEGFKFYDYAKWLDFLIEEEKCYFSYEAKNYFNQTVTQTSLDYFQAVMQLKTLTEGKKQVEIDDIKNLFPTIRYDQFQLLNLLTQKKFRLFFEKMLELDLDSDIILRFSLFVQSHFIKIYDPTYMDDDKELNNFEKQIKYNRRDWKDEEIKKVISFFSQLEQMSKANKNGIQDFIRSSWLKTFV
jgi:hypothetical protein